MPGRLDVVGVVDGLVGVGDEREEPGPRIPQCGLLRVQTGKNTDRLKQVGSQVNSEKGLMGVALKRESSK